jgi:hypothetical protein
MVFDATFNMFKFELSNNGQLKNFLFRNSDHLLCDFLLPDTTSFSDGRSRSTRREPPTMGKQLVSFITCECESSAHFFAIYKTECEPTPYWRKACMSC